MSKPPAPTNTTMPADPAGAPFAVTLDAQCLDTVDAWASSNNISRSDAIGRLVKLGLTVAPAPEPIKKVRTSRAVELAAEQISQLIDPAAPSEERDRLISRLTQGPPEFVEARVDLPKRRRTDQTPRTPGGK
jgi:hypothetical protein